MHTHKYIIYRNRKRHSLHYAVHGLSQSWYHFATRSLVTPHTPQLFLCRSHYITLSADQQPKYITRNNGHEIQKGDPPAVYEESMMETWNTRRRVQYVHRNRRDMAGISETPQVISPSKQRFLLSFLSAVLGQRYSRFAHIEH